MNAYNLNRHSSKNSFYQGLSLLGYYVLLTRQQLPKFRRISVTTISKSTSQRKAIVLQDEGTTSVRDVGNYLPDDTAETRDTCTCSMVAVRTYLLTYLLHGAESFLRS